MTHDQLVAKAKSWLRSKGCQIVFGDEHWCCNNSGERPDAIGFRSNTSVLVECKSSRKDFLSDKNKPFRETPELGMGEHRFYLCPPGIINVDDLPEGWGLLYGTYKGIVEVTNTPKKIQTSGVFNANQECEKQLLYSALRKLKRSTS